MINNLSRFCSRNVQQINKNNLFPFIVSKKFSGDHGHDTKAEEDYHQRKYDRVSYNVKLSDESREKIAFMDYMNEKDSAYLQPKLFIYKPDKRYEVLVPFETTRDDRAEFLLDRTEVQARIYNLLRRFDLKPLEEFNFDGDYEKDLGLDSLEWTALVTSIEHEFHTVFEDSLFEHLRTINDYVEIIEQDHSCF